MVRIRQNSNKFNRWNANKISFKWQNNWIADQNECEFNFGLVNAYSSLVWTRQFLYICAFVLRRYIKTKCEINHAERLLWSINCEHFFRVRWLFSRSKIRVFFVDVTFRQFWVMVFFFTQYKMGIISNSSVKMIHTHSACCSVCSDTYII